MRTPISWIIADLISSIFHSSNVLLIALQTLHILKILAVFLRFRPPPSLIVSSRYPLPFF